MNLTSTVCEAMGPHGYRCTERRDHTGDHVALNSADEVRAQWAGQRPADEPKEQIMPEFRDELRSLINRHSKENESNTPDFILATFLAETLELFDATVRRRESWHGRIDKATTPDEPVMMCGAFEPPPAGDRHPFRCTESAGHPGLHMAWVKDEIVATWDGITRDIGEQP